MSIQMFDPHAGGRRQAQLDRERAYIQLKLSRPERPESSVRSGCKCDSCGSREYRASRSGSVCAYCRSPEKRGGRSADPMANSYRSGDGLNNYLAGLANFYGQMR